MTKKTNEAESAEVLAIDDLALGFKPDSHHARGDCRDVMLAVIKSAANWSQFDEQRQRDINAAVDMAAIDIVRALVDSIAATGKQQINATLEQLTVKDGLKITLKGPFTHQALALLGEAQGKAVLLTVADADAFSGEKAPAPVDVDQPDLLSSETDDLADSGDE